MKCRILALALCCGIASSAFATVSVSSPTMGQQVGSPVHYVATASAPTCNRGVASMGVYVDDSLKVVQQGASLNTQLTLNPGTYNTVVQEWDYCGGSTYTPITIQVSNQTGVFVSSPTANSTVSPTVNYVATARSSCSAGVASMGVYVDNSLQRVQTGSSLNTTVSMSAGKHNTVVQEWDYCGGSTYTQVPLTVSSGNGVNVTSPTNNSTVSSPVNYVATATSGTCPQGVASMGIYVNNNLVYVVNGSSLNHTITLGSGAQHTVVQEWDYCGGSTYTPINVTVSGSGGHPLSNLQASGGWHAYGQFPPDYNDCSSNCSGVGFSFQQHQSSPSLSGNATKFNIWGSVPYSDVLFTNPLIGQNSSQGLPDSDHTLLPTIHNFTYDADFYVTNAAITQVLEFDINMYMDGMGFIFGNQCDNLGDHSWDVWNNTTNHWESTGAPCKFTNGWNHVTIQVQRESDNWLYYQSITLNGVTYNINRYYQHGSANSGWWGVTVNYQMDGNYQEAPYSTYLDNFTLTYW
jgi:hypothetical protein